MKQIEQIILTKEEIQGLQMHIDNRLVCIEQELSFIEKENNELTLLKRLKTVSKYCNDIRNITNELWKK